MTQYDHGKVPDRVYGSVLKQAYKAFKFFHGKFQNILDECGEGVSKINRKTHIHFFWLKI